MIKIWTDGAARPNPGKGGIGIVIEGDGFSYTISEAIPGKRITNNAAEYLALLRALNEMIMNNLVGHDIEIFSDAQMMTEQMCGNRQVDKGGQYVETYFACRRLCLKFSSLKFTYIPREENAVANLLASQGVKKNEL